MDDSMPSLPKAGHVPPAIPKEEPAPPELPKPEPLPSLSIPIMPELPRNTPSSVKGSRTRSENPRNKSLHLFAAMLLIAASTTAIGYFAFQDQVRSLIANVDEQDTKNGAESEGDPTESTHDGTGVAEFSATSIPSSTPNQHSNASLESLKIPSETVDVEGETRSPPPTVSKLGTSEPISVHDQPSLKRDMQFAPINQPTPEKTAEPPTVISGHSSYVWSVAYSPNGDHLASASQDKSVRIWECSDGELLWVDNSFTTKVFLVKYTPSGDELWACSQNEVVLFESSSGRVIKRHSLSRMAEGTTIDYECERLYAILGGSTVVVLDLRSGRKVEQIKKWTTCIAIKQDDSVIAFGGFENEDHKGFESFRLPDLEKLHESRGPNRSRAIAMTFSPNGRILVHSTGLPRVGLSDSPSVKLFDMKSGQEHMSYPGIDSWQWGVTFSRDSKLVAMGGGGSVDDWWGYRNSDKNIRVWDVSTGKLLESFSGHNRAVLSLSFSPDGKKLASGSVDSTIRFWELKN